MTFGNIITLLFVVGFGYMMFKGGGCCGSHGGHKGPHGSGEGENDSTRADDGAVRKTDH